MTNFKPLMTANATKKRRDARAPVGWPRLPIFKRRTARNMARGFAALETRDLLTDWCGAPHWDIDQDLPF